MSFQAYVYVEDWSIVDRPMALLVQLQMANRADKTTGVIDVSHRELAADCRLRSPSAVKAHIDHLVAIGEVEILDPGGRGRGRRARYRFPRMAAPPTAADRHAAAKNPPPRAFSPSTTVSDPNGKDLPGGVFDGEQPGGKDLEKTSKSPPGRVAIGTSSPSPSVVTGSALPHPESASGSEGPKQQRKKEATRPGGGGQPRVLRAPDDPEVIRRVDAIRAKDGPKGAAAYRRRVEEAWARKRAGDLLADELGRDIGRMP